MLAALAACNGSAVSLDVDAFDDTFWPIAWAWYRSNCKPRAAGRRRRPAARHHGGSRAPHQLERSGGVAPLQQGNYSQAVITLDYSAAQIIYDNGTADGLALTPISASGQEWSVTLLLYLDPSDQLGVPAGARHA